ncbi:MAG: UDP-3-O-(3-hydroxymyristoyl)glucosamine N-acyltransferase [Planctomycetes bacterium]|nr:UDP-3-O-(3-hydroxymyristoyl)glucosamine N-acyltransferase [Planctomycetota bacterium]
MSSESPDALSLAEVAALVEGRVLGDASFLIRGVSGIQEGGPEDITFLANSKYRGELARTRAAAVLIGEADVPDGFVPPPSLVVVPDASLAFSRVIERFAPPPPRPAPGIHAGAVVSPEARVGEGVSIGPFAVVEAGARIGARSILYPGVYVGHGARVGEDCVFFPNVVVLHGVAIGNRVTLHPNAVIGSDGFGYVLVGARAIKVPQQGIVELADDVEIGAGTTVDRARFERTWIGRGSKIDNLCQIAHNVQIGESTYIAAQTGVAGSSRVGSGTMMGGQVGVSGHLRIGGGVKIAAQAGVSRDIPDGSIVAGHPAMPARQFWRMIAMAKRLPELVVELEKLTERVAKLEGIAENDS